MSWHGLAPVGALAVLRAGGHTNERMEVLLE